MQIERRDFRGLVVDIWKAVAKDVLCRRSGADPGSCFVSSDLVVARAAGGAWFKITASQNGVFAIAFADAKYGLFKF